MNEYFLVVIPQHIERVEHLLTKIDNSGVPREYHVLAQNCRTELISLKEELVSLQEDPDFKNPNLQKVRLRQFRRLVDSISKLESTGILALSRQNGDDIFLTRLVDLIRKEVKYPFLPPAVSTLSSNYFSIHNKLGLMFVPLSEGNYLLHLPDLYHELAHPLLFDNHNTLVEEFRRCADMAMAHALEHLDTEKKYEERRRGPEQYQFYFYLWQHSWGSWIIEFFCDLFAIFTLGPAFAWAHIHLCMKSEHHPFEVPTRSSSSHPADAARMHVMLLGLEKVGYHHLVDDLKHRWNDYLKIADVKTNGNYKRCFPNELLEIIVNLAYEGIQETPCRIVNPSVADPVHSILNEAWQQFWCHPYLYLDWEKEQINRLQDICGVT